MGEVVQEPQGSEIDSGQFVKVVDPPAFRPVAPAPVSESGRLTEVISRAAADPNTNVDKLDRLLGMYERITAAEAKRAFYAALSEVQDELPIITERGGIKNKTGDVQSTYALWEDINEAIKPVLKRYGMALSFRTGNENDKIVVTGILSHKDGHTEETTLKLPVDNSGSKNSVQAVGSSTSYGKRYTAGALLNLTSRGEDDDGKAGGANAKIDETEVRNILDMLEKTHASTASFCDRFEIDAVPDLPKAKYRDACELLNARAAKQAKEAKEKAAKETAP